MASLMNRLVDDALDAGRAFTRPMVAAGVLEMIARLHQAQRVAESSWKDTNIESARLDILMRTSEKIDWHAMAQQHGMSHATFRRRFKEVTGRSPLDYQIEIRLSQAVELLRHSGLTVSAIAELLGYTNVHFFSRQFKGRIGITPKSVRERVRD
jgi:transcriptional regulator GlxA family with amidase domain